MTKKLVISPHVDDEVLGCGGILNNDSFVYYCGIDESKVAADEGHRIPIAEREQELRDVSKFLGFQYEVNYESKVNHFTVTEFIGKLESVINRFRPEYVFVPHPGYNQDHKTIFDACQIALRPHDNNFFVRKVLVYEGVHDQWSYRNFRPNCFVAIDVKRKNQAYMLHKSQVRPFRSPEMIEAIARARGIAGNCGHAEAFQILRWVENSMRLSEGL